MIIYAQSQRLKPRQPGVIGSREPQLGVPLAIDSASLS